MNSSIAFSLLLVALRVLFSPIYVLMRFGEELSGEGGWYRRQHRKMVEERPPLRDNEFLNIVNAAATDARMWLAVRRAVAEQAGVPAECLYPHDRLADLWRMQYVGPDLLDIQVRMELMLEKKLVLAPFSKYLGSVRYGQPEEFHEFAEAVVRGLTEPH